MLSILNFGLSGEIHSFADTSDANFGIPYKI